MRHPIYATCWKVAYRGVAFSTNFLAPFPLFFAVSALFFFLLFALLFFFFLLFFDRLEPVLDGCAPRHVGPTEHPQGSLCRPSWCFIGQTQRVPVLSALLAFSFCGLADRCCILAVSRNMTRLAALETRSLVWLGLGLSTFHCPVPFLPTVCTFQVIRSSSFSSPFAPGITFSLSFPFPCAHKGYELIPRHVVPLLIVFRRLLSVLWLKGVYPFGCRHCPHQFYLLADKLLEIVVVLVLSGRPDQVFAEGCGKDVDEDFPLILVANICASRSGVVPEVILPPFDGHHDFRNPARSHRCMDLVPHLEAVACSPGGYWDYQPPPGLRSIRGLHIVEEDLGIVRDIEV